MNNKIQKMGITEKRWRDGSGVRYLVDEKTIRCQGVSKTKLALRREETNNPDLKSEDVWPELQCMRSAEPGVFACRFHGGKSLGMKKTHVLDFMPTAFQEKVDILLSNPDYLSRKEDIVLFRTILWSLAEDLDGMGGVKSWETILDTVDILRDGGELKPNLDRIEEIASSRKKDFETVHEMRATANVIKDLTRTEVTSVEKLRTMASFDQVAAAFEKFYRITEDAVKAYVEDEHIERRILQRVANELREFAGASITQSG